MKARLGDRLPFRFKNAVTLARRALQCERLESRCLMHGVPLAIDYEAALTEDEADDPAVIALIGPSTATESQAIPANIDLAPVDPANGAPAAPGDNSVSEVDLSQADLAETEVLEEQVAEESAPEESAPEESVGDRQPVGSSPESDAAATEDPVIESDDSREVDSGEQDAAEVDPAEVDPAEVDPAEVDPWDSAPEDPETDDSLEAEGEAYMAGPQLVSVSSAAGASGTLAAAASSSSVNEPFVTGRAGASLGDGNTSLTASRVANSSDIQSGLGALSDSLARNASSSVTLSVALSLSGEDSSQQTPSGASADRAAASTHGIGLSLNAGVQAQALQAQSLQPNSLQTESLQTQSLPSLGNASAPWLSSSTKLVSAFAGSQSAFSDDRGLADAMRSFAVEEAANFGSQSYASDSTENPAVASSAESAYDDGDSSIGLRVTLDKNSLQRKVERATASSSMNEEVARQAKRYIQRAYLRVREGGDGVVELAIGQSSAIDDEVEAAASDPATGANERGWVFASMGLYREFDLVSSARKAPLQPANLDGHVEGSTGVDREAASALEAIDAAHAEDMSADDAAADAAANNAGQAALPLTLLGLTGLLAVSRRRYAGKQRANGDA